MKRFLGYLLPEYVLTRGVFLATLAWSLVLHFGDLSRNDLSTSIGRVVAVCVATVALFGTMAILNELLLKRLRADVANIALIPVMVLASVVRGIVLSETLVMVGYVTDPDYLFRIGSSVFNIMVALMFATAAYGLLRTHRLKRSQLLTEKARLEQLNERLSEQLAEVSVQLIESIQHDIRSELARVDQSPSADLFEILKSAIDDVVRPLSHYLHATANTWAEPALTIPRLSVNLRQVLTLSLRPQTLNPLGLSLVVAVMCLPAVVIEFFGWRMLFLVSIAVLVGSSMLEMLKRLAVKIAAHNDSPWRDVLSHYLVLAASGAVTGVTLFDAIHLTRPAYTHNFFHAYWYSIFFAWFYVLFGTFVAAVNGTVTHLHNVELELQATTDALQWQAARARETYRQRLRTLSRTLHGQIQAAMASAYLRLQSVQQDGGDVRALASELLVGINAMVDSLNSETVPPAPLDEVIEKVRSNWAGIAEIEYSIDSRAAQAIGADELCQTSLVDLIPELCFNSIKHGRASRINVVIKSSGMRTVQLSVIDNGVTESAEAHVGLGSELLESSTIAWDRVHSASGSNTRAVLAVLS